VLEIQKNEAWLPNELHYLTFKAKIAKCYDVAFYENSSQLMTFVAYMYLPISYANWLTAA